MSDDAKDAAARFIAAAYHASGGGPPPDTFEEAPDFWRRLVPPSDPDQELKDSYAKSLEEFGEEEREGAEEACAEMLAEALGIPCPWYDEEKDVTAFEALLTQVHELVAKAGTDG
jgi:hypothetical protein